jgi:hypothetical protein
MTEGSIGEIVELTVADDEQEGRAKQRAGCSKVDATLGFA